MSDSPPDAATRIAWTIAGHDPSSGAGVTADQLTLSSHGLFAGTVITALTAQSTLGVAAVEPVRPAFLRLSLERLLADLPPAGVKIGMLGSAEVAAVMAEFLQALRSQPAAARIPIVFDPVLVSSSGRALYPPEAIEDLHRSLLPHVDWITPNYAELSALTGTAVADEDQARAAAKALATRHANLTILVTGGDRDRPTDLLRLPDGSWHSFAGEHIDSSATHGTGCALSSALLAALVLGHDARSAVSRAKHFVEEGIRRAPRLGHGKGPLNLLWPLIRAE